MTESATRAPARIPAVVRAARPRQWLKNALVLIAPAAAGVLDQRAAVVDTALAFVAFCLASSAVYLFNDAADADADRAHPIKRSRPVAGGEISEAAAQRVAAALGLGALAVAFGVRWEVGLITVGYLAVAGAYSAGLKQVPYLELAMVAAGFWLRAVAGAVAADVTRISAFFALVVTAGALFTITGKRHAETRNEGDSAVTRPVLARYRPTVLRRSQIVAGLTVLGGYLAWMLTARPDGVAAVPAALATLPLASAIARFAHLSNMGRTEEPEEVLFQDPLFMAAVVAWAALYGIAVYA